MNLRLRSLVTRLSSLVPGRKARLEAEMAEEMRLHIEQRAREYGAGGMTPDEARFAAQREFGHQDGFQEQCREARLSILLQQFGQDLRYALRGMRRHKGFTFAAVAMLTVGIGFVAGGFSLFNGLFLRGWPVRDSAAVYRVEVRRPVEPSGASVPDGISLTAFRQIQPDARTGDLVASLEDVFVLRLEGDTEAFGEPGFFVSDNFISTIGVPLQLGAGFGPAAAGEAPRILISDPVWRRRFSADPGVVGRTVWIGSTAVVVAGVTAPGFDKLGEQDLDVVAEFSAIPMLRRGEKDPEKLFVELAGRLKAGATVTQAEQELQRLVAQHRAANGQRPLGVALTDTALARNLTAGSQGGGVALALTLIAVGLVLVLLLTCANVGNLFLARSLSREREIATRLSLGASRARLIRQFVTEGLLLSAAAGSGAWLMTRAVAPLLQLVEDEFTDAMFAPDWRVTLFTGLTIVVTCLLVSLAPALQVTRMEWRGGAAIRLGRAGRARGVMLAVQIAIAFVLVLSAALIGRGILQAVNGPTDFARETTAIAVMELPNDVDRAGFVRAREGLILAARESPLRPGLTYGRLSGGGVRLGHGLWWLKKPGEEGNYSAIHLPMDAAALSVLELQVVEGRRPVDDAAAGEALVNQALARRMWPGESAVGKPMVLDNRTLTVAGVVRDAHLMDAGTVRPMIHLTRGVEIPALVFRQGNGAAEQVRALVAGVDPRLTVTIMPMARSLQNSLQPAMAGISIAGGLGIVALTLALIGVYGVFSYTVEERRREIGIRLALGAQARQVAGALFRATRRSIVGGLVAGLVLSGLTGLALRSLLFGLSPADPVSYLAVALVLAAAAAVAIAIPLLRAVRVNPAETLRAE